MYKTLLRSHKGLFFYSLDRYVAVDSLNYILCALCALLAVFLLPCSAFIHWSFFFMPTQCRNIFFSYLLKDYKIRFQSQKKNSNQSQLCQHFLIQIHPVKCFRESVCIIPTRMNRFFEIIFIMNLHSNLQCRVGRI